MQQSARIASLIELIEQIEEGITEGGAPADVLVGNYFRARRYAGSKDRRFITEMVYSLLRQRELLLWIGTKLSEQITARFLVIAFLALNDEDMLDLFAEEDTYAPNPLSADEVKLKDALLNLDAQEAPAAVRFNVPAWALEGFEARYGERWQQAAKALNSSAPVDLRLNKLKSKSTLREGFLNCVDGLEVTKLSPLGIRSQKNIGLGGIADYKRGNLEVQDEAAQIASLLVEATPGMQVVDFCAGAGGKSLTISAEMDNKGQLYAFDVSEKRLSDCKKRVQRAGARNIQVSHLSSSEKKRSAQLTPLKGVCDRVFVDAPCSGTGTWRRSPDQRWRQGAGSLVILNELQYNLLEEASALVKPEGRLLYMTCSVLPQENETIVRRFLETNKNWVLVNYQDIWKSVIEETPAETLSAMPEALQLSPETHDTDGFFVAVLTRQK